MCEGWNPHCHTDRATIWWLHMTSASVLKTKVSFKSVLSALPQYFLPTTIACWAQWQIRSASSMAALARIAFLWHTLTDVISANHSCLSMVVWIKQWVWSIHNRMLTYSMNQPWRQNAEHKETWGRIIQFWLGQHLIKTPICICSALFLLSYGLQNVKKSKDIVCSSKCKKNCWYNIWYTVHCSC